MLLPSAAAQPDHRCFCSERRPPVEGLRSRIRIGQCAQEVLVDILRFFPLLARKGGVGEPQLQLAEKVVRRKKALELMAFDARRIQHLNRWRPLRTESLERLWLVFGVDSYGYVIVIDETFDVRVRINLGIQPSASSSHRSRAEIDQHRALNGPRLCKCGIDIFLPFNGHKASPFST